MEALKVGFRSHRGGRSRYFIDGLRSDDNYERVLIGSAYVSPEAANRVIVRIEARRKQAEARAAEPPKGAP